MNKQKIAVLADTGTNVPADYAAEHDVHTVSLRIHFSDGSSFRTGEDIDAATLIERMADEVPSTSLPSPEQISTALEQARFDGYEKAVFLTISAGLSATNQTVRLVASQMKDFPVTVINTKSIGPAAALIVMAASEMVEAGIPYRQLGRRLEALSDKTRVFFSTKTLDYLRKGGRISEPVYRLGSLLNIKPVITCDEAGYTKVARKTRGWEKSLDAEVSLAVEHASSLRERPRLAVFCSPGNDHYEELEGKLLTRLAERGVEADGTILRFDISPDLLVHAGPDAVGIAVTAAWR